MKSYNDQQLFKKVACLTDIHFGRRGNDKQALQDNMDFLDWFIAEAKAFEADTIICLGDYHDNRHNLNVNTMHYSLAGMEKLANNFDNVIMLSGNHDLFFRENRNVSSIEFGRHIDNLSIIDDIITIGNVTLMPWLVGDEWKTIPENKSKYIFGHFELPNFFMNGMTEMPDHGGLNQAHFKNQDYVFSGHFHKRQARDKVIYIGNTFPFSFSDAWDDDRGMMLLEWGTEPQFKEWPDAPTYRTMKLSEVLENPEQFLVKKSYNRISIDVDISYEEAQFVKDTLTVQFRARKIDLVPVNKDEVEQEFDDSVIFQTIDQIVIEGLNSVQSTGIDNATLVDIYNSLK